MPQVDLGTDEVTLAGEVKRPFSTVGVFGGRGGGNMCFDHKTV